MSQPLTPPQQFRSTQSGRNVVPGWTNLLPERPDTVEIQLDLNPDDYGREHALVLAEYWATPDDVTLQSILPVRAFREAADGWCVFVPSQGRVLLRAIDPQPSPPVLASQWLNIDPQTPPGTVVSVAIQFPGTAAGAAPLSS
ncbi:uracil-DNA glycosylase [Deinococcus sp. RL]|uniref:hypothetical protein n=1 Tax=Deinococcus sp. RL TaxID=1489678 RepID=UPI0004D7A28A|nr:hypothetical protein [Deinococcus sp. RL]KEF35637.1 uracil-DNA glycosylase [Deinococcus sp. RL]